MITPRSSSIELQAPQPPPAGTGVSPGEADSSGIPHVRRDINLQLFTQGCTSGAASYQIISLLGDDLIGSCTTANDPAQAIAETGILVVPPVAELDLALDCGGSTSCMPLIGR